MNTFTYLVVMVVLSLLLMTIRIFSRKTPDEEEWMQTSTEADAIRSRLHKRPQHVDVQQENNSNNKFIPRIVHAIQRDDEEADGGLYENNISHTTPSGTNAFVDAHASGTPLHSQSSSSVKQTSSQVQQQLHEKRWAYQEVVHGMRQGVDKEFPCIFQLMHEASTAQDSPSNVLNDGALHALQWIALWVVMYKYGGWYAHGDVYPSEYPLRWASLVDLREPSSGCLFAFHRFRRDILTSVKTFTLSWLPTKGVKLLREPGSQMDARVAGFTARHELPKKLLLQVDDILAKEYQRQIGRAPAHDTPGQGEWMDVLNDVDKLSFVFGQGLLTHVAHAYLAEQRAIMKHASDDQQARTRPVRVLRGAVARLFVTDQKPNNVNHE